AKNFSTTALSSAASSAQAAGYRGETPPPAHSIHPKTSQSRDTNREREQRMEIPQQQRRVTHGGLHYEWHKRSTAVRYASSEPHAFNDRVAPLAAVLPLLRADADSLTRTMLLTRQEGGDSPLPCEKRYNLALWPQRDCVAGKRRGEQAQWKPNPTSDREDSS